MSQKKIVTLDNLSTFKGKCDLTYQPINSKLTSISGLSNSSTGLVKLTNGTASIDTSAYATETYVNNKVASAYIYKGTKNISEMNALQSSSLSTGWVYNVSAAGTITSGDSNVTVNAGDNVAWDGTNWDILAGTVDLSGYQTKVAAAGSTTKPLYTSAAGTFAECSTYAGGTKVTLNNTNKGASTATIYAPTSGGAVGTILIGAGATSEPSWLAAGTSGKFLKCNGSGTAPSWETVQELPTTTTAYKMLLSTTTSGQTAWSTGTGWGSTFTNAFLRISGTDGTLSIDTNSYLTSQTWRAVTIAGTSSLANSSSTALNFSNAGNVQFSAGTATGDVKASVDLSNYVTTETVSGYVSRNGSSMYNQATISFSDNSYSSCSSSIGPEQLNFDKTISSGTNAGIYSISTYTPQSSGVGNPSISVYKSDTSGSAASIQQAYLYQNKLEIFDGNTKYVEYKADSIIVHTKAASATSWNNYTLTLPTTTGTIALTSQIPSTTTTVTSGSAAAITSGGMFTALGFDTNQTALAFASTSEIEALFA